MTTYWCEHAWLGSQGVRPGVTLQVDGDRITGVGSRLEGPAPQMTSVAGLTLPAFANAHSHAFQRALRGRTQGQRGTFWTWRDLMYRVAGTLDPDNYYRLARATFAEMAQAGVGVVGEFHYVHHRPGGVPYDDPNAMGAAVASAAADVGIRLTLLDTVYLHGGFGSGGAVPGYRPPNPDQARFSDGCVEAWASRVDSLHQATGPTMRIGAAAHSLRAVDPDSIEVLADWSRARTAPLHAHVSEQPAENEHTLATLGLSPIQVLAAHDALGPQTTLVHATHVSAADIATVSQSDARVCLCPTTERDLADGIGPSAELADAGIELCLGTDSHAIIDPLEETRAVELDQRLALSRVRGRHHIGALAEMATGNGYRSLGWADGGRLAEGALADFTTVNLDTVRLAGIEPQHALAGVIFAGAGTDVTNVVVAGRPIVADGHHVSIDVVSELRGATAEVIGS